jgi:acetyltransferase-like isoleucine patch superfamily enzyme
VENLAKATATFAQRLTQEMYCIFQALMRKIHSFVYPYARWRTKLHRYWWRAVLGRMGSHTRIMGRVCIKCPEHVEIGDHCTINDGVGIFARDEILRIGNYVRISPNAMIIPGGLNIVDSQPPPYRHYERPISIEDGVWIGAGAIVLGGVTVGHHSVIAAGAVVTEDVPPYVVVAGVPARVVRQLR